MKRVHNIKSLKTKRKDLRNSPTYAEKYLWYELRKSQLNGRKFRRQQSIGKYIVDFYCPEEKLVVEVDGEHHYEDDQKEYDTERTKYLKGLKIKVIRFKNTDVVFDRDKVVKEIENQLNK
jgi:very-short-patch-repair endonuclease